MNPERIRRALRAPNSTDARILTLAGAIFQVRPPRASHERVLAQLPEFIDAELEQQTHAEKFLELKRHLLLCPRCAALYLDLLETAQLDAQHQLPRPPTLPRPDLGFLI
ncbi:MAG: hypothetical protein HY741_23810 [Chloroflexi bacterium]|nr:hypothetical protein [Chloroflexota bacterium]